MNDAETRQSTRRCLVLLRVSVRNTQTTLGALKLKGPSGDSKQPNESGESDNSRQKALSGVDADGSLYL